MEIVIAVALVAALVEVVKKTNYLPKEVMPFLAILLGMTITFVSSPASVNEVILTGFIVGLTASGFFDASKVVVENTIPTIFRKAKEVR